MQSPQSESTPRRLTLTYLLQPFANKLPTFEQQFILINEDCGAAKKDHAIESNFKI